MATKRSGEIIIHVEGLDLPIAHMSDTPEQTAVEWLKLAGRAEDPNNFLKLSSESSGALIRTSKITTIRWGITSDGKL